MNKLIVLLWLTKFLSGEGLEARGVFEDNGGDAEMNSPGVMTWLSDRYASVNTFFGGARAELQALRQNHDSLCGDITEPLSGSCTNLATCLVAGGTRIANTDSCGPFGLGGVCCKHSLKCGDNMNTRIGYWESDGYPKVSNRDGPCTLRVSPVNNICYLRIEFYDLILTAPRVDSCEGNTLTIRGQVEGTSGTICGNLNGHETFIQVNEGTAGIFRVYDELLLHLDIEDEFHKYKMKLTQIKCDQELDSLVRVETTSDSFLRKSHSPTKWRKKVKIFQRVYANDQKSDYMKQMERQQRYNWIKRSVESLPGVLSVFDMATEKSRETRVYSDHGRAMGLNKQLTEKDDMELLKVLNKIAEEEVSTSDTLRTSENLNATITDIFSASGMKQAKWNMVRVKDVANLMKKAQNSAKQKGSFNETFEDLESSESNRKRFVEDNPDVMTRKSKKKNDDAQTALRSFIINQFSGSRIQPETKVLTHRKKNPTYLVRKNLKVEDTENRNFSEGGYVVLISPLKELPSSTDDVKQDGNVDKHKYQAVNTKISENRRKYNVSKKNEDESVKEQNSLKSKPNYHNVYPLTSNQKSQLANFVNQHIKTTDTSQRVKYTVSNLQPQIKVNNRRRPQHHSSLSATSNPSHLAPYILADRIKSSHADKLTSQEKKNMASNPSHPAPYILADRIKSSHADKVTSQEKKNMASNSDTSMNLDGIIEEDISFYGYLVVKNEVDEYFFCSASLITPRHALTTASCVMRKGFDVGRYKTHVVFKQDDIGLSSTRTGASLFDTDEKYLVVKTVFHPMYRHGRFHYDVAVLHLDSDVYGARPIRLAAFSNTTSLIRDDITILGHGVNPGTHLKDFRAYGRYLSYMNTKQVLTADCADSYRSSPRKRFTYMETLIKPELMCVSSEDDTQMCEGDQGAPVVINFGIEADPLMVGIAAGNDHNCIGIRESEIGAYPDVIVPITPSVENFIRLATSNIKVQ